MKRCLLVLSCALAFAAGTLLAEGGAKAADKRKVAKTLLRHQKLLFKDLTKIERAVHDIRDIAKSRADAEIVLNHEEKKLERQARKDFHIFMERCRNDTLQVLRIYDRVLEKEVYIDPLERVFGKSLKQLVKVGWDEAGLEEIVDDLNGGYGVNIAIRGDVDLRRTMSLHGEMTLMGILLQIENVFDARLILKKGQLWFVNAPPPPKRTEPAEPEEPEKKEFD